MRTYNATHAYYCGIDLHARSLGTIPVQPGAKEGTCGDRTRVDFARKSVRTGV